MNYKTVPFRVSEWYLEAQGMGLRKSGISFFDTGYVKIHSDLLKNILW